MGGLAPGWAPVSNGEARAPPPPWPPAVTPMQTSPSELTHATFISARNRCSDKIRRARSPFRKRKIDKLKNVSDPYPKTSSTTVTPAFPHLFALMAL